ncbi:DEAD/DEAH box helicase [Desulfurococcus mucosus]|uniref:ATP-dependent DNA helicase Hel308 n=1 Tax=Desulfurococcus mucosus (strain ATCC 35584 / DSM 2162 / JCM 9187 / O7/1) TaxID=765177 RepID=E8R8E4_DESM0|nr:DEAD/DEAH box helicase [Desulfurococcus mucosus]ADV64770.1 DEAD/DEAH box helicase domain protein [Desulfurococcus mucosus DSM 2162]
METAALRGLGLPEAYVRLLEERGIRELNPVQSEAVEKGLLGEGNMVVSAPTASGKTLIAELALVDAWLKGGMGVYLTPLRALASEKYWEFKTLESIGVKVGVSTGDYDQPADHLGGYDILVATYERFDSILRLKPWWLPRVSVVVVDEVHMVGDPERGPIIEVIAARLLKRGVRVIGLSATVGNPGELADWLHATLVATGWRPVKLVEGYLEKHEWRIVFPSEGRAEAVEEDTGDPFLDIPLHNAVELGVQTLVFTHNRRRVEEYAEKAAQRLPMAPVGDALAKLLRELEEAPTSVERDGLSELMKRGVAFHHAGLSGVARSIVEKAFRERLIRILYATPTLAAGVNLPARRVLVSVKRYDPARGRKVSISVSEYKQMAGRAGRPRFDEKGESIIVDASSSREALKYIEGSPEPVAGKLLSERSLRIHVLSLVASGEASSTREAVEALSATLSMKQSGDPGFYAGKVEAAVKLLTELGMIEEAGGSLRASALGRITSYTYLDPLTISVYRGLKPPNPGLDLYLLHVVSMTPDFKRGSPYIQGRVVAGLEDVALDMSGEGLIPGPGRAGVDYDDWLEAFVHAMILYDWINEASEDEIVGKYSVGPGDLYSMRDTAAWITHALARVEGVLGDIAFYRALDKLSKRLEKGVREDALELASLRLIGRVRARILIEHGFKTLRDLAEAPVSSIASLPRFGQRVAEEVERQLRELGLKQG